MEINESDRFAWFSRGKILATLGHLEQSLVSFERAIALKPTYYDAWAEKGAVLEQLGRLKEANFCFNESLGGFCDDISETLEDDLALIATPTDDSPGSSYNQACFHGIQGNVELAIMYLEKAISFNRVKYSEMALNDEDLKSIGNNPKFQQLITFATKSANVSCPLI